MKIFDYENMSHRLTFISRQDVDFADIVIFDKYDNFEYTIKNVDVFCKNGYLTLTFDFQFVPHKTYFIKVANNDKTLFQDLCRIQ